MDSYYERNPVLLYIAKRIVEDVLDKTNEDYISAVSSPEADVLVKKLESFSQDQIHRRKAQPPAQLVEWDSPPGAKPLHFRLKAV